MPTLKTRRQTSDAFPVQGHDHAACVSAAVATASAKCARDGQRLTTLRRRVLELVWQGHRPVGAYAILEQLKTDGRTAAPPTVYRALDFLLECGLVHRIESLNAYVGCPQPEAPHRSQFLICRRCGTAAEIDDPAVSDALGQSAAAAGFSIESRVVELKGLCADCRRELAESAG